MGSGVKKCRGECSEDCGRKYSSLRGMVVAMGRYRHSEGGAGDYTASCWVLAS